MRQSLQSGALLKHLNAFIVFICGSMLTMPLTLPLAINDNMLWWFDGKNNLTHIVGTILIQKCMHENNKCIHIKILFILHIYCNCEHIKKMHSYIDCLANYLNRIKWTNFCGRLGCWLNVYVCIYGRYILKLIYILMNAFLLIMSTFNMLLSVSRNKRKQISISSHCFVDRSVCTI